MKTIVKLLRLTMLMIVSVSCASVQKTSTYSIAPAIRAVEYVEITAELNSTWESQTKTNHHRKTERCVVGTNDWFIAGDFLGNAETSYWLVGTNVIEHRIVTNNTLNEVGRANRRGVGRFGQLGFHHATRCGGR